MYQKINKLREIRIESFFEQITIEKRVGLY